MWQEKIEKYIERKKPIAFNSLHLVAYLHLFFVCRFPEAFESTTHWTVFANGLTNCFYLLHSHEQHTQNVHAHSIRTWHSLQHIISRISITYFSHPFERPADFLMGRKQSITRFSNVISNLEQLLPDPTFNRDSIFCPTQSICLWQTDYLWAVRCRW